MAKNKAMPLIAGLAVVAVFGAGWLVLKSTATDEETDTTIPIDALDGQITKIEYTVIDDDDVSLVYKDDEWQWAQDADFPLRQTYPETMVQMGQSPAATALVTDAPENLAEYGLDTPAQTITLTNDAGESKTYLLGNVNSHTGEYYLCEQGQNSVYTVQSSFGTAFSYALYAMINTETWPVTSASNINEVTLTQPNGSEISVKATLTEQEVPAESGASSAETTTETITTYTVSNESGKEIAADETAAYVWFTSLSTMSFEACTDYKSTEDTLKMLGLDDASAQKLTVKYTQNSEEKTFTLLIGHGGSEGVYFTKQAESAAVNTINGEAMHDFLNTTYASLTAK